MKVGIVLRALPQRRRQHETERRLGPTVELQEMLFDARDWELIRQWSRMGSFGISVHAYVLGLPLELPQLLKQVPDEVCAIPCPITCWSGPGLVSAAQALTRAVRRVPVDYLAVGMGGPADPTVPFASTLAATLRWPLILAVAATGIEGSHLRVTRWADEGYARGIVRAPAVLAVKLAHLAPYLKKPDIALDRGTSRIIHVHGQSEDLWLSAFLDTLADSVLEAPWGPLAPLRNQLRQPVWVWGDVFRSQRRLSRLSRQLIGEARRLVVSGTPVTVACSTLPTAEPEVPFLDGADAVIELAGSSTYPSDWAQSLLNYWEDGLPALLLIPASMEGQALVGALIAHNHVSTVEYLERTSEPKNLLNAVQKSNTVERNSQVGPAVAVVTPETFNLYDGCYHRTGAVLTLKSLSRSQYEPVWTMVLDSRTERLLYGHAVVVGASAVRMSAIKRALRLQLNDGVHYQSPVRADFGAASVYLAVGIDNAPDLSHSMRMARRVVAVHANAMAPIVHQADVALVGPEEVIMRTLSQHWREIFQAIGGQMTMDAELDG